MTILVISLLIFAISFANSAYSRLEAFRFLSSLLSSDDEAFAESTCSSELASA